MLFLVEMFSWILPILAVLVLLIVIAAGYVKAPPDQAYIISGLKKEARILIGRAGIRVPFFERLDRLYLGQMTVDIKTEQSVPTNDFINVNVDAVAKVRISPTPEGIRLAAKNFLNKKPADITMDLQDSLQGNMREIIGTLSLKEINTDRDSFSDQVMSKASKDMDKLGIEILSCNIQNVTDENGLIKDLGADNTSKIKKDAAIAKAQADRDIAIAQAETEIAQKNNELAIRKAELQKDSDSKKAEADAAYEIQRQEQERTIQTATVNAQIAKAAREAELRKQEVLVQEQALQAEVNKKADADRYAVEQKAAADLAKRQREAEAKKYEMEKEAEALKAQAEKEAEAIKAKAEAARYASEQEAAGIKAKGEAEAAAIQAKLLAEAEGMERKAEAYAKYNNAAVIEMMVNIMPQMAAEIAKPLSSIDKVNIYGGGGESGVGQISGNAATVMQQVFDTMSEATGVDFREILKAQTYDAKVNHNLNLTGIPESVKITPEPIKKAPETVDTTEKTAPEPTE